jgi:hypothetical protein
VSITNICISDYQKYFEASPYYGEQKSFQAYLSSKIRAEFKNLEAEKLVKIKIEKSFSFYDYSHLEDEKDIFQRVFLIDEALRRAEDEGLWCYVSYYRPFFNADWLVAGSIDAIVGNEFDYSGFDTALMSQTLDCYRDSFKYYSSEIAA